MTATAKTLSTRVSQPEQIRPIQLPQDLSAVADLIEMCFAPTLDADGRRFIRQMRRAGQSARSYRNFHRLSPSIKGFVWVEDRQIIGNLNLIPVTVKSRRAYLIVNVAVHPDYRRQGIAHTLTATGLQLAQDNGGAEAWLQVDHRNVSAQHLYHSFGFEEQAQRTAWHSQVDTAGIKSPSVVKVTQRHRSNWKDQRFWLQALYPPTVRWNLPININLLAPGFLAGLSRFMMEQKNQQWSAHKNGRWIGSATWQKSHNQADWLWLAAPPENREEAIRALLPNAIRDLRASQQISAHRTLAVNFPAGDSTAAFEAAGFHHHQTLIWMNKILK